MFTSIGKKPFFYNKSIMDYSLKTTNDYIKKKIQENEDTKKIKCCIDNTNLIIKNNSDNNSDNNSEYQINYLPFYLFLSFSSLMYLYSYKKQI